MGPDPPIVVYDACVLYPFHLRNLLIELAVHGLVAARWTDTIHDEWIRNLAATRGIPHARLVMTRDLMKAVLPNANVQGWERLVGGLMLPDANDRHVLAAAIIAQASMILTWNTRHFLPRWMRTASRCSIRTAFLWTCVIAIPRRLPLCSMPRGKSAANGTQFRRFPGGTRQPRPDDLCVQDSCEL
jgi:hypothetical protein